jgi:FKBP-type peptidyl-prolyl cis-trans isomerase 2
MGDHEHRRPSPRRGGEQQQQQQNGANHQHRGSRGASIGRNLAYEVGEEVEFYRDSSGRWYQATVTQVLAHSKYGISIHRRGKQYNRVVPARSLAKLETHVKLCRLGREVEVVVQKEDGSGNMYVQGIVIEIPDSIEIAKKAKGGVGTELQVTVQYIVPHTGVMKEDRIDRCKLTKFGTHLTPEEEKLDDANEDLAMPLSAGEIDEPVEDAKDPNITPDNLDPAVMVPPEYQTVEKGEAGELDEEHGGSSMEASPVVSPVGSSKKKSNLEKLDLTVGDVIELQRPSRMWVQATVNRLGKRNMIVEFVEDSVMCRRKVPVHSPFVAQLGTHIKLDGEFGERAASDFKVADHVEILRPNGKWIHAIISRLGKRNALVEFFEDGKMQRRKFALSSNAISPLGVHLDVALGAVADTPAWDYKVGDRVEFCDLNNVWVNGTVRKKGKENVVVEYMSGQAKAFKKINKSSRFLFPLGSRNVEAASKAVAENVEKKEVKEVSKLGVGGTFEFTIDDHKYSGRVIEIRVGEIDVDVDGLNGVQRLQVEGSNDLNNILEQVMEKMMDKMEYDMPPDIDDQVMDDNLLPPPSYEESGL